MVVMAAKSEKNRLFQSLVVCLGLLLASVQAYGKGAYFPQLTVVTESFPPYNYQVKGEPQGMSVEVLQAVLQELDYPRQKYDLQFMPWVRAYRKALNQPNVLIFSIARIPEREELFHWVGEIAPYRTSIYKLRQNPIRITSLDDAKSYEVGVSQQDVIYTYLRSEGFAHLDVIGSDLLNIRKLKHQRIPLIAYDEAAFNFAMRSDANPNDFEQVLSIKPLSGSLYMAFSEGSDQELIEQFEAALKRIKADGRYQKILQRYFDQVNVSDRDVATRAGTD
ncbi:substrate-binding periplasmic protein [Oceanospirillum sanctuarii]|uniref:substrate-binding periplasmic protein n=1 Tax=Oceanospirillum sanctuarii TaxID=1434821 RepID=UPI000A375ACD|nr:ABC transporter substrate-binding protein [Oceanospirillum sanctuarii]